MRTRSSATTSSLRSSHRWRRTSTPTPCSSRAVPLRLCHFPDYRYSADIDLNVAPSLSAAETRQLLTEILVGARERSGLPVLQLSDEAKPRILFIGPKRTARPRPIKLDLANDELTFHDDHRMPLLARYPDQPVVAPLLTYSLVETAAEKVRCVMQRLQCRDLFDLWTLFEDAGVDAAEVAPMFAAKARHRGLDPDTFGERFAARIEQYRERWSQELTPLLGELPDIRDVLRVTSRHLRHGGYLR